MAIPAAEETVVEKDIETDELEDVEEEGELGIIDKGDSGCEEALAGTEGFAKQPVKGL